MDPIDSDFVRDSLPPALDLVQYVGPNPDTHGNDPLDQHVAFALDAFPALTGLLLENVPVTKEAMAKRALMLLTLKTAMDITPDRLETIADFDLLSAFSVTGYSETRRKPDEYLKMQLAGLTGWAMLDGILLLVMDPDRRDEILAVINGTAVPAVEYTQPDWYASGYMGGIGDEWGGA